MPTKITEEQLEKAGFSYNNLGDEVPFHTWDKDGVEVWCFNSQYWLVDALDQGSINVAFHTMEELNQFFLACKLPPIIQTETPELPKARIGQFIFSLETNQQKEFMSIVLATAIDVILNKEHPFVRHELPIGWQEVFASKEKQEAMTRLLDTMLDRIALSQSFIPKD